MKGTYIELDAELYRRVKHLAVDEGVSFKQVVEAALRRYLASTRKGGKTR